MSENHENPVVSGTNLPSDTYTLPSGVPPETMIYRKIALVMGELTRLPKNSYNAEQKYAFASAEDIADAVRQALAKHRLAIIPSMDTVAQEGITARSGTKGTYSRIRFKFLIACGDTGATIETFWEGESTDYGDKGLNKAATIALKFFQKKLFSISTGDEDPDAQSGEGERGGSTYRKPQQQPRQQQSQRPQPQTSGTAALQQQSQPANITVIAPDPDETPQAFFARWISSPAGQKEVSDLVNSLGHPASVYTQRLNITRFSEWKGGNPAQFVALIRDIAAELNKPATPKHAAPEASEAPAETTGMCQVAKLTFDGKRFVFKTPAGDVSFYGGRGKLIEMVGERYASANKIYETMPAVSDREIAPLNITWQVQTSKQGNPYKVLTDAKPVSEPKPQLPPDAVDLDEIFGTGDEPDVPPGDGFEIGV